MVADPTDSSIPEYIDTPSSYGERTFLLCVEKHQYDCNVDVGGVCIHRP